MTDRLKTLLIAIATALTAIGVAITLYVSSSQTPTPEVSALPSPSPTASLSPVPSPSPSPSPRPRPSPVASASPVPAPSPSARPSPTASPSPAPSPSAIPSTIKLLVGMTEGFEFTSKVTGGFLPSIAGVTVTLNEIQEVTTIIPTYKGARVGKYFDRVLPPTSTTVAGKRYWVDFTGNQTGKFYYNLDGDQIVIDVAPQVFSWPVPLYMEMQFSSVSTANGLADEGNTFAQRIALNKQYASILRAHGVEPIKHGPWVYPNLTDPNFKTLALDGRIAPPCLFGPSPQIAPTIAYLQSVQTAIVSGALPAGTYAYAWDEGEGDVAETAAALARVKYIKQYAPALKVMITRQYSAEFAPYVDIFVPVVNFYNQPGFVPASAYAGETVWLYHSCMSANRCNNAASASAVDQSPSKFAMHAIDAPETDTERFVTEAIAAGAKGLLYYNTTESITTSTAAGGQYKFGNNGDGNDLYPGLGYSKKLKFYRRGLNKEALKRAGVL